ncbi:hypothetical protein C8J55DRAFT_490266 [Lentinula edodes]|uniref:WD40 repeat-like protein n=1 Tax=Lentinula lateritia TaxID=40482 RepID=A0A9W9A725_9AGAR|nr:hypothetical protein C8J55DRAFT_490266 [Lentinula edodes]
MVQKENVEVQSNQWPIKYGEHIGGDKGAKVDATAKGFENAYPLQTSDKRALRNNNAFHTRALKNGTKPDQAGTKRHTVARKFTYSIIVRVPQYEPLTTLSGARDTVVSLAFLAKAKFLSAAGYSGVFVWDLSTSAAITLPHMLFAPQNPKYVITSSIWVYFQKNKCHVLLLASMRGDLRDISVFPFYGGEMGSVALSNTSNKFVAYTGKNFHLYRLASLELLKTYSAKTPVVMFSKTVAFGESKNIIVGGTDRGHALIYEVNTEELLQTLTYPRGGLVQPVTTITLPDRHLIAIAGSTAQQSADVILFEKRIPLEDVSSPQLPSSASCTDVTPNHSSTDSVLIGFHLSKQIWDWARILALVALLTFAGYYTVYQVWVF